MKKFENLGRSLSKEDQKKIMGGDDDEGLGGDGKCLSGDTFVSCTGYHCNCTSTTAPTSYSMYCKHCD